MSRIKDYGEETYGENFAEDYDVDTYNQPTGFEVYDRMKEQLAWEAEQERIGGGRW